MDFKIFSLKFEDEQGGFGDSELREFIKNKTVISWSEYFFVKNEIPHLAISMRYHEDGQQQPKKESSQNESWKKIIQESEIGLFNILREWRSKRCKKEGLPPYILFTNIQLAQVIKVKPQSLTELSKIEGIGESKLKKYGEEILHLLKSSEVVGNTSEQV